MAVATMPWAHPDFDGEVMQLKLAPDTASGFKGVHKAGKKWEAKLWVAGRGTRVVWRCSSAKECAFILARLEVYPCEVPTPKKGRAKPGEGQVRSSSCSGSVRVHCADAVYARLAATGGSQAAEARGGCGDRARGWIVYVCVPNAAKPGQE